MIEIRFETSQDFIQIRKINIEAFGRTAEADIVDKLREHCPDILSLVAEDDGAILGHILFSPVNIEGQGVKHNGMGLGPMAVLPSRQNQGIGSKLIRAGLKILRKRGCAFVIVLGHTKYYPKFGFEPASKYGIICQWPRVPDEAFMVLELSRGTLSGIKGTAKYCDEFNEVM